MFHRTLPWISLILVTLLVRPASAAPPEPQGTAAYYDGYHQAMIELREGKWREAAATLTTTEKVQRGDGRILLARGVVRTLSGEYADALSDLGRVRLQNTREPKLWTAVIDCLTDGQAIRDQAGGRSRHWFGGVPGHLVQGGKDYPTSFGSFVVYDMAWPQYLKLAENKPFDEKAMAQTKVQAGRWFANRMLATKEYSSRNFRHAEALLERGQLREAMEFFEFALAPYPFDADVNVAKADVWLSVGRPATARPLYTVAATINPALGRAYAGRARAAAMMGDRSRAEADVKTAVAYGSDAGKLALSVASDLRRNEVDGDPSALLAELDKAAAADATVEQLVPIAENLHRVINGRMMRYDELYQETIRELDDKARADAKNIEPRLDLAEYLLQELNNRGETVEPRRGRVTYRVQFNRGMEVHRALFYADKALAIDPKSVRGMVLKAWALDEAGQERAATQIIDEAVKLAGTGDAQAIRLLAEFRRRQVGRMLAQAAGLRTPTYSSSTHTEHRSDGVWRVTTTTRYDPTQAELAQAAALVAAARQIMQQTKGVMESAIKLSEGTLQGYLLGAAYEDWFGTRAKALAKYRESVRRYPKELKAHDALVEYLRFLGQRDEALEAEATALQLVHTSCGPLLSRAWNNVERQGFGPLLPVLERARKLAPTDVRGTAYMAEAERDLQDKEKSAALFKVAAALETARLKIDEQGEGKDWPRPADDMAALMQSHLMIARLAKEAKDERAQIAAYEAVMKLFERYPPDGRETPMFGAVFINGRPNRIPVSQTPNGARLAAVAFLEAGRWYEAHGRADDAKEAWTVSARLGMHPRNDPLPVDLNRPNVGTGDPKDSNFNNQGGAPSGEALVDLAKVEIEKKNYKKAFELLQAATRAQDLPRGKRQEINQLFLKIIPEIQKQERGR